MASSKIIDKDTGWSAFFSRVAKMKGAHAKVGILAEGAGAEEEDGSPLTVAQIAGILEFGTEPDENGKQHIPERSFVRSTFDEKREEMMAMSAKLVVGIVAGTMDVDRALNILGAFLAAAIKNKVTIDGVPPPNAPSTIAKKGDDKPLINTSRMINAVTWVLVTEFGDKFSEAVKARTEK